MQPSILFLLLGWLAVANSFGLDLRLLNPFRTSGDNHEPHLPPSKPNRCNPMEPRTLIRNTRKAQRNDFVPLPTPAPTNNSGGDFSTRIFVPLPTKAPTTIATSTTTQASRSPGDRQEHLSDDCDPFPLGIGTRLSAQLLKVLTILG